MEGLYKLGNTQIDLDNYIGKVETTLQDIQTAMADIPDSIISSGPGDITTFTKGELDRYLWQERYEAFARHEKDHFKARQYREAAHAMATGSIAGIGSLQNDPFGRQVQEILLKTATRREMAFKPFTLHIPNPIGQDIKGFFQKIGDFFKRIGNGIADAFKKFVNWIFKGVAKGMGPYFIFLFANKNKVKSPEIRRRINAQQKTFDWIAKAGRLDTNQLKGALLNGIKDKTGKTPQEIFTIGAPQIGLAPALVGIVSWVVKAIGWVIKAVQKVVGLFNKNQRDAGVISEANMSDLRLLDEEINLQSAVTQNTSTTSARKSRKASPSKMNSEKSGGDFLIPAALLAVAAKAFVFN